MRSAVQRGLWRLVRRRRCERALSAIHEGLAADAHRALTHVGAAGDRRALALTAIATALDAGSLSAATGCIAVLENASPDPETCAAAGEVLAPVLWVGAGCLPESVPRIARLTARLMRVTGSLPWGRYNLAVHALQVGDHRAVENHLAAAAAPSGGWPLPLLDAAYAAIVGDAALLARSLAAPRIHPVDADDHRFLTGVDEVFACLRTDHPVDLARLGAAFGRPAGSLATTVPTLSALQLVLSCLVGGKRLCHNDLDLGECIWGRWVCDRLRFAGDEALDVLATPDSDESALRWQQLGARQDLGALLPDATARELPQRLSEMRDSVASNAFWGRLTGQRVNLGGDAPAVADSGPRLEIGPCPWWPADGVLQTTARREAEVECGYLDGRRALRNGDYDDALRRIAAGRAQLSGGGVASRLVDLRFGPLLRYWEGVILAHLGHHDIAMRSLRACEYGVMAREARAQLGLLAVAVGDHVDAARLLATINAPRPPAADYLAAVVAAREGATDEVTRLVDGLVSRESVADAYVAAGQRLRGRIHEMSGEFAAADRAYRDALGRRPTDLVAAVRLARVWLRRRYDDVDLPSDPLLDRGWTAVSAVAWAAPLLQVRDCVRDMSPTSARQLLDQLPSDPNLYLLTVWSAVAAGAADVAESALRACGDAVSEPDARLVHASRIARAAVLLREFCAVNGRGPARTALADMMDELAADPRLAFWAEAVRRLHDHESALPTPPIDVNGSPSVSAQLFAALLSVFSADSEQRCAGGLACRTALSGNDLVLEGPARAMVRCLAADALGDDAALLTAYSEIETDTDALPCDIATAFLAVTEARLRVGDLDAVIDGAIPAGLADLADVRVRRAMGVAYARRAARTSDRDPRAALRDIDQACDLLGETT